MTISFNLMHEAGLGYAAIFICIGFGFIYLRKASAGEIGPGYWAASFLLSGLGFFFWAGVVPWAPVAYYLVGEAAHVAGFFTMVCGAYRFTGHEYRRWNVFAFVAWIIVWAGSICLLPWYAGVGYILLKLVRAILFIWAGQMILTSVSVKNTAGRRLSGWSLIAWAACTMFTASVRLPNSVVVAHLSYGLLAGFQIASALGMVALVVDRLRIRAEESENRIKRLEGLLPICSYCKKIRDDSDNWQSIETYIRDRSDAEFSHGICPDCLRRHFPGMHVKEKESS